jgi:hypothetical protein
LEINTIKLTVKALFLSPHTKSLSPRSTRRARRRPKIGFLRVPCALGGEKLLKDQAGGLNVERSGYTWLLAKEKLP